MSLRRFYLHCPLFDTHGLLRTSCSRNPKNISYKKSTQNAMDNHKKQIYLRFELQNNVKQHLGSDKYQENLKFV